MSDIFSSFGAIFFGFIGLIFAGVGIMFLLIGIRSLWRSIASRNWQQTEGTVVSSAVGVPGVEPSTSNTTTTSSVGKYQADVQYEYNVGGAAYSSSRVSFAPDTSADLRYVQTVVHRYPVGAEVTVRYDRSDPREAVLETGIHSGSTVQVVLGLALVFFGSGIVTVGINGPEWLFDMISPKLVAFILPQLGLIAGIVTITFGIRNMRRARASARWPSVPGRVVASTVERTRDSSSSSSGSDISTTSYTYQPIVTFGYQVDGSDYLSNTITFGDYSSSNRNRAEQTVARYPVGTPVRVFHDPDDPATGVLERRAAPGTGLLFIVGIMFTLISALFLMIRDRF